jgi:hypothetical protein
MLRRSRGQATLEMALVLFAGIVPLTLGLITFAEIAWTYHALAALTRQGARYASTHCWQDSAGSNVIEWMQVNAPAFPDRAQIGSRIEVRYWTHNAIREEFSCGSTCNAQCVPDSVTVSIVGYEFNHFLTGLGLPALQVPPFTTTVAIESAGGDPDADETAQ